MSAWWRKALRELERIERKLVQLDQRFIAELQDVLTEEQLTRLPLISNLRARARARSGFVRAIGFVNPSVQFDLSDFVRSMDLDPRTRNAVDPTLRSYESRLTTQLTDLDESVDKAVIDIVKEVEEKLQVYFEAADFEAIEAELENMQMFFIDTAKPILKKAGAIGSLNRSTAQNLEALMPADAARRMIREFHVAAYPEMAGELYGVLMRYEAAQELEGLAPESRQMVASAEAGIRQRSRSLSNRFMDMMDDARSSTALFELPGDTDAEKFQEKQDDLEEEWEALKEDAEQNLLAMIGESGVRELDSMKLEVGNDPFERIMAMFVPNHNAAPMLRKQPDLPDSMPKLEDMTGPDPWVPAAIESSELEWYLTMLNLSDDERAVVESLHADYIDAFAAVRDDQLPVIRDMVKRLRAKDDVSVDARAVADVYAIRQSFHAAARDADAAFFENVALVALDPNNNTQARSLNRVRSIRDRIVANRGEAPTIGSWGGGWMTQVFDDSNREYRIDLGRLVADTARVLQQPEVLAQATPVLERYDAAAAPLFRDQFDSWIGFNRILESLSFSNMEDAEDGEADDGFVMPSWQDMNSFRESFMAAQKQIAELNRSTITELVDAVDGDASEMLDERYKRLANPAAWDDPQSAEGPLRATLTLAGLTPERRERAREMLASFAPKYRELSESMARAMTAQSRDSGDFTRGWERRRRIEERLDQTRFDRGELNRRTLRALRLMLDDQQAWEVGYRVASMDDDVR